MDEHLADSRNPRLLVPACMHDLEIHILAVIPLPQAIQSFQHILLLLCTEDTSWLCVVSTFAEVTLIFGARIVSRNAGEMSVRIPGLKLPGLQQ